jgi:hypothetical protein
LEQGVDGNIFFLEDGVTVVWRKLYCEETFVVCRPSVYYIILGWTNTRKMKWEVNSTDREREKFCQGYWNRCILDEII